MLDKVFNFSRGPFGIPGSYHTDCPYSYSQNNKFKVIHGASHRHIYDLSAWDNSRTVIPTGTSGIPASEHYLDQIAFYINNRYHADPFNRSEVISRSRYKMRLIPIQDQIE
jgi:penicillin amidase